MVVLINRLKAWRNLFKLGPFGKFSKEMGDYCRDHVVSGLKDNILDFLNQPHTISEIQEKFDVSDNKYLVLLLEALLSDNTIEESSEGFLLNKPLTINLKPPKVFDEGLQDLAKNMAKSVLKRLNNQFFNASSGSNLFTFDDALSLKAYEYIRHAALSFVPNSIEKPGKFLDLGCGNGTGTADLWIQIMRKCNFQPKNNFELVGIDINEDFINIANNELYYVISKYSEITEDAYLNLKHVHPKFKIGTTTKIPYPDKYFDYIYTSQVLHWTDMKSSIAEIYRCLKPGGIYFGTNILFPHANLYLNLLLNTIDNANGFFTREEFIKTAEQVGFSKLKFCTPLTIFKFQK